MKKLKQMGEFLPGRTWHPAETARNHSNPHPAAPQNAPAFNRLPLCAVTGAFRTYSISMLLAPLCPGTLGNTAYRY